MRADTNGWMNERMDGWLDGWVAGWQDRRVDGWTGYIKVSMEQRG